MNNELALVLVSIGSEYKDFNVKMVDGESNVSFEKKVLEINLEELSSFIEDHKAKCNNTFNAYSVVYSFFKEHCKRVS